jgi:hypothetical protein
MAEGVAGLTRVSVKPGIAAAMRYDRSLFADFFLIGINAILGIGLALLLLARPSNLGLVLCGACAAILPDALQFAYTRSSRGALVLLQRFYLWMHASRNLNASDSGAVRSNRFGACRPAPC